MPKIKTHSGAKKRFDLTKNGKVKHIRTNRRHKLNYKTTKHKRRLRKPSFVDKTNVRALKKLIPYK